MNMTLRVIIDILLGLGVFFTFVGVMGVVRMPDVFGRLQASTCIGSLGNIFLALGGIVYAIGTNAAEAGTYVKLIVIMLMVLLTNPVSNHSMCRAACNSGVLPSSKMVINDYKEDDPE